MGKIVKYCNTCEESFAEKFSFCPICGDPINAFEMKPVETAAKPEEIGPEVAEDLAAIRTGEVVLKPLDTRPIEEGETASHMELPETVDLPTDDQAIEFDEPEVALELDEKDDFGETLPISKPYFSIADMDSGASNTGLNEENESDEALQTEEDAQSTIDYSNFEPLDSGSTNFDSRNKFYDEDDDDDFHVTVLTEKNVKERNLLLLGTMVLMLLLCVGVVIGSIFNHPLLVGAIGDDDLVAFVPVVEEVPMTVEEEKRKLDEDKGGGGGGGGREEQTPTSKGRLSNQTPNPLINPDVSIIQRKAELQQPVASTQGDQLRTPTDERYGDPNSLYDKLSNGLGRGGGQGSGEGTGQGSGRGTGQGSGIGSGSGSGIGDGRGGGTGTGGNRDSDPPAQVVRPAGPTIGVKIISKPEPKYTDAARQNNIQGQVVLRITFLSNGQIGGISPVSGLSYGLTEQAIAAARQIRFEPALRNGQPYSVTKTFQYRFAIY